MILEIYNDIPKDYSSFEKTVIYGEKLEQKVVEQEVEIKRLKEFINNPFISLLFKLFSKNI